MLETKGVVEVLVACMAGTAAGSNGGIGAAIVSADGRTMMALAISSRVSVAMPVKQLFGKCCRN